MKFWCGADTRPLKAVYSHFHRVTITPMTQLISDSIFWVEVDKVHPNPYQPRREFDEAKLRNLSDSIRQYGVLQPLVVTRREQEKEDGGISVEYELIAGERRLRASKIAGLSQIPVIIRSAEESDLMKLELAIIENLQREDLNVVDRAYAFERLAKEFGFKHAQIALKVGKSREYVSNTLRVLLLPENLLQGLSEGMISEGHTRPLMMLVDRPQEQQVLYKEITTKKLSVREAEAIARRIAVDRARKHDLRPEILEFEREFSESFGTRVRIEPKEQGGKLVVNYMNNEDLESLLSRIRGEHEQKQTTKESEEQEHGSVGSPEEIEEDKKKQATEEEKGIDDSSLRDAEQEDEDLYSIKNFSL